MFAFSRILFYIRSFMGSQFLPPPSIGIGGWFIWLTFWLPFWQGTYLVLFVFARYYPFGLWLVRTYDEWSVYFVAGGKARRNHQYASTIDIQFPQYSIPNTLTVDILIYTVYSLFFFLYSLLYFIRLLLRFTDLYGFLCAVQLVVCAP